MSRAAALLTLLLVAAAGAATAAPAAADEQPPVGGPRPAVAAVEAALDDIWKLLSIDSLHQRPLPGGALPQLAAQPRKRSPPAEPAAPWAATLLNAENDAWELLRRTQAAEAGPAAAAAATLPARLVTGSHAAPAEAGSLARLPTVHPTLTLRWWLEHNETTVGLR